jgi:hypothetical protein
MLDSTIFRGQNEFARSYFSLTSLKTVCARTLSALKDMHSYLRGTNRSFALTLSPFVAPLCWMACFCNEIESKNSRHQQMFGI